MKISFLVLSFWFIYRITLFFFFFCIIESHSDVEWINLASCHVCRCVVLYIPMPTVIFYTYKLSNMLSIP